MYRAGAVLCYVVLCCVLPLQLPPTSHNSGGASVARECHSAIKRQQNFELQLYITPPHTQQLLLQQQQCGQPLMQAQFRCAANTGLDNNMLPIGIPNFLPDMADGGPTFYFATLRPAPTHANSSSRHSSAQLDPQGAVVDSSSGGTSGSGGAGVSNNKGGAGGAGRAGAAGGGGGADRRRRTSQFSLMPPATNHDPLTDIKLGPLLGKGAFGRVGHKGGGGGWNSDQRVGCARTASSPAAATTCWRLTTINMLTLDVLSLLCPPFCALLTSHMHIHRCTELAGRVSD